MDIVNLLTTLQEQVQVLKEKWNDYDFFFLHYKYTDSTGEDGNLDEKVKRTEELDSCLRFAIAINPEVLIVTGDHSTPAYLKSHSWHPVPRHFAYPIAVALIHTRPSVKHPRSLAALDSLKLDLMLLAYPMLAEMGKYGAWV